MVGSSTSIDTNITSLVLIFAEWTSGNTYQQRVNNLRNGTGTPCGGANGTLYLPNVVVPDAQSDQMTGGIGLDYFWGLPSEVLDLLAIEELDS